MMLGLLWMLAANAGVILAARAALRTVATGRPALDAALFLFLRLTFIMASVLAAGLAGGLRPHVLGLFWLAVLGALVARGAHRGLRVPWPDASPALRTVALLLIVRAVLHVWFFFPFSHDPLSYHLPKVAFWVRDGAIGANLGPDPRGWFPAGFELLETWWCVFLHHDVLIEAAGLEFQLLGALAVAALASWLALKPRTVLAVVLLWVLVPGLAVQAVGCMNDAPVAALFTLAVALIAERAHPMLVLAVSAVGVGVKPTYAYLAPGLVVLAAWLRSGERAPAPSIRAAALLLAVGAGLGGYWFARNAVLHGNPVHPAGASGIRVGEHVLQQTGPSLKSLATNLDDLGMRIHDQRRGFDPLLEHGAGWGPAVFAIGIPCLAAAAGWQPRMKPLLAAYGTSLVSILALTLPDPFTMRFLLFVPALPLLALGVVLERVRLLRWPSLAAGAACAFFTMLPSGLDAPVFARSALETGWRDRSARPVLFGHPPPGIPAYFDDLLFPGCLYALLGPDFRGEVALVKPSDPQDLLRQMRAAGATWLATSYVPEIPIPERVALDTLLRERELIWWSHAVAALRHGKP
ncbi:MAG TPA: hypothetical protein VEJ18_02040 [Planctomycetota bacterium]|nr:hypothetical protein [Planctomycetota bacterium]